MSEQTNELEPCPSCGFDLTKHAEHARTMFPHVVSKWESYCPVLVPLLGVWFVNCQNCGFTAAWDNNRKEDAVNNWNQLPRHNEVRSDT